ncbi:MAG: hypothetical protein JXB36_01075 [Gammaproteobacteria bacterium]|nr:hypothetical protein [Gammaproteobacteria bacterium]
MMPETRLRRSRRLPARLRGTLAAAGAALLAACGGGGGGDGGGGGGSGDANAAPVPGQVVVSGTVTFDYVPIVLDRGIPKLGYTATVPRPARGVTVQAVDGASGGAEVLASATTDEAGRYALTLTPDTSGLRVLVRAEMLRDGTPGWDFRVVDNTQGDALYVLESEELATGRTDQTLDLHAASGWDGSAYTEPRAAAPFAILDAVHESAAVVLDAAPDMIFPPLALHWSPDNAPTRGDGGLPDFATGEIGSSLFIPNVGIYVLGSADSDTDEYDRHVIAHEWGHYLEFAISRSDSIGGPHTRGDQLDMRTAFSEGFANAFSGIALGDTVYKDTLGPGQSSGFLFDVEGPFYPGTTSATHANPHPGWFSEESVHELIYDLYDAAPDIGEDTLALGLAPLFEALAGQHGDSEALTSIFPFVRALKEAHPEEQARIDTLVGVHDIEPVEDHFGTGEDNGGTPTNGDGGGLIGGATGGTQDSDVLPIYNDVVVNGAPVEVCSTDDYRSEDTGSVNKLGSRAFLRLTASGGVHTFTASTTVVPDGASADPDMRLHRRGVIHVSDESPEDAAPVCAANGVSEQCETFSRELEPGQHVLEVYEWTNTSSSSEFPPIGRTCFDVTITQ